MGCMKSFNTTAVIELRAELTVLKTTPNAQGTSEKSNTSPETANMRQPPNLIEELQATSQVILLEAQAPESLYGSAMHCGLEK